MGVLAEYVQKEAEHLRSELARGENARGDWLRAFALLTDQLKAWVHDADGGSGLLQAVGGRQITRQEAILGVYEVTALSITLGGIHSGRVAQVVPVARYVGARIRPPGSEPRRADGMAEIRSGSTAEYYLFRVTEGDEDRWYIQSVARWNADAEYGSVEPLDRDRFETAVLRVLK